MDDRQEESPRTPLRYNRRFDAFALSAIGIGASLFIALGVAYRDNQNAVVSTVNQFQSAVREQLKEYGVRLTDLERWAWSKGKR